MNIVIDTTKASVKGNDFSKQARNNPSSASAFGYNISKQGVTLKMTESLDDASVDINKTSICQRSIEGLTGCLNSIMKYLSGLSRAKKIACVLISALLVVSIAIACHSYLVIVVYIAALIVISIAQEVFGVINTLKQQVEEERQYNAHLEQPSELLIKKDNQALSAELQPVISRENANRTNPIISDIL